MVKTVTPSTLNTALRNYTLHACDNMRAIADGNKPFENFATVDELEVHANRTIPGLTKAPKTQQAKDQNAAIRKEFLKLHPEPNVVIKHPSTHDSGVMLMFYVEQSLNEIKTLIGPDIKKCKTEDICKLLADKAAKNIDGSFLQSILCMNAMKVGITPNVEFLGKLSDHIRAELLTHPLDMDENAGHYDKCKKLACAFDVVIRKLAFVCAEYVWNKRMLVEITKKLPAYVKVSDADEDADENADENADEDADEEPDADQHESGSVTSSVTGSGKSTSTGSSKSTRNVNPYPPTIIPIDVFITFLSMLHMNKELDFHVAERDPLFDLYAKHMRANRLHKNKLALDRMHKKGECKTKNTETVIKSGLDEVGFTIKANDYADLIE